LVWFGLVWFGWLVGWLVWLVGWFGCFGLVGWLVGWFGWSVGLVGWFGLVGLVSWLVWFGLVGWLVGLLVCWLVPEFQMTCSPFLFSHCNIYALWFTNILVPISAQ
jgi:hypothetical protein